MLQKLGMIKAIRVQLCGLPLALLVWKAEVETLFGLLPILKSTTMSTIRWRLTLLHTPIHFGIKKICIQQGIAGEGY